METNIIWNQVWTHPNSQIEKLATNKILVQQNSEIHSNLCLEIKKTIPFSYHRLVWAIEEGIVFSKVFE